LIGGGALVASGNGKKVYGVRLGQARSKEWSVASIFSRNSDEGWLGMLRAAVTFGFGRGNHISPGKDQVDASNDAPGIGDKMRRRSRARAH
jgi:hypothetical protein